MSKDPVIALEEYAARRNKVLRPLGKSMGMLFAGEDDSHADAPFRPHPHFEYLTGITDEPGGVLVLDPATPIERRRAMLFLKPLDPEVEKWDGYRLQVGKALRDKTGMDAIYRTDDLPRFLGVSAAYCKSVACLHPLADYDSPVSPDLAIFQQLAERIPGLDIADKTQVVPKLRAVKSEGEVALIQKAIDITALGFSAMLTAMKPGMNEYAIQETIEHTYRTNGSRRVSFPAIVGSGMNSTVLHYRANDQTIADGDLVCVDSGAVFGGYAADITRTVPANGTFTKRQREVYEVVLRAQEVAIKACKPGATLADIDRVSRAVITKAGFGDYYPHSIGHHLGLETHDSAPPAMPLAAGSVVTIEPGVYIPEEKIGIRIEDDILITKTGPKNLSKMIPKTAAEIERAMRKK